MLSKADTDADGKVSLEELKTMLVSKTEEPVISPTDPVSPADNTTDPLKNETTPVDPEKNNTEPVGPTKP